MKIQFKLLDQRKGIIIFSSCILFITCIVFLVHFYFMYDNNTKTTAVTDSNYLSNEQSFFDNVDDQSSLLPCPCDPSLLEDIKKVESEKTVKDRTKKIETQLPPVAVMKKVNANLLKDRVLIVATANYGMRNHVYNWIESIKRTGEKKFLIFCFDQKLYDHLCLTGHENQATLIPEVWYHQQVESDFKTYFSQEYRVITHSKTLVVQQLLYLDIHVLFSDVDIVWLRKDIVHYMTRLLQIRPETGVLFQQEGLNQQEINSGFYLMRSTDEMKLLLAETIEIQDSSNNTKTQQGAMNTALNQFNLDIRTSPIVLLDILHFPNGYVYYTLDLPNQYGIEPYIVHANYLVGEDKKQKLVSSNFWYLNDTWLDQIDKKLNMI
ncbi:nucleotide-diphospho-sugar transferase-domain-containing protein [Cokeromyces recurvatus]|uniref:nucleotide-diphospho-sugar transferase-domain-containing protein n=1 Tax=Cokeromyces recurvatus TaxID=90255 RepID=UPI002220BA10|nr:nucleotide-diphospho-sugar transferase-domain-containing protein [Cokeromyces recurvatus]KAI7902982.1 nucleotide-diphospho-sugar transferase-domain-containing protein [Cokeromyces recurvatus]